MNTDGRFPTRDEPSQDLNLILFFFSLVVRYFRPL